MRFGGSKPSLAPESPARGRRVFRDDMSFSVEAGGEPPATAGEPPVTRGTTTVTTDVGSVSGGSQVTGIHQGDSFRTDFKFDNASQVVIYQGGQPFVETKTGEKKPMIKEEIRLDVAAPPETHLNEPFDLAVAVRQPKAPKLAIEDLSQVTSAEGAVFRTNEEDVIKYRLEVTGSGVQVSPSHYVIKLRPNENSQPYYFQVTPLHPGRRSLFITAYQQDEALAAQTRITLEVQVPVE
jgi:hypothetical protein